MFIHQLTDPNACATLTKLCFLTALSSRDPGKGSAHEASESFKKISNLAVEAIDYCEQEMLGRLITTFLAGESVNWSRYGKLITDFFSEEVKPVLPSSEFFEHLSEGVREVIYFDIATKILKNMVEKGEFTFCPTQMKKLFSSNAVLCPMPMGCALRMRSASSGLSVKYLGLETHRVKN